MTNLRSSVSLCDAARSVPSVLVTLKTFVQAVICSIAIGSSQFAAAQPPPASTQPSSIQDRPSSSDRRELTNDQKDIHFIGHVELDLGNDAKVFADDVVVYGEDNRAVATGHVLFAQGENRLSAERAEFNTETRLGTFFNAWGIAAVQPPRQQTRPGQIAAPQMATNQPTTVYFFGDKIDKLGAKKYRITNGGFSTCVQPTPRWDLHADTVILNLEHYTVLKQAVLAVKGVPMLYVPLMYYPTKSENRATGFLLPTYGQSTVRGHQISNAFFWAIDRSQDATILHDWFSKVGQGVGGEYRYNWGGGSDGNIRTYLLNQHEATYGTSTSGTPTTQPGSRSYEISGSANQLLPGNLHARARVDYWSSIETMQTFHTNIYDASRNQRTVGANVIGGWGTYTLSGTLDHSEYFYSKTQSILNGGWPRVTLSRNERPLLGSPLYFSVGTEFAHLLSDSKTADASGVVVDTDHSLSRYDFNPQLRYPFKKWQWFTVNSTVSWRDTYYSRSVDPVSKQVVDDNVNRRFFSLQSQLVGPVVSRIWNTPDNGYAEKFKHTIEPVLGITRTSAVDNFDRIVLLDGTDGIVGGTTYVNYGLNNRIYAKRPTTAGGFSSAREIASVELSQTYYTNESAAQYDSRYSTTFTGTQPSHFSALALRVRVQPTDEVNATVSAEFDSKYKSLRTISASGTYSWTGRVQTTLGWSKKAFIEQLAGFNDKNFLDHYVNTSTNVHTRDNRFGGIYAFNFDVLRSSLLNQRMSGFYNAQCCGIAFEYQTYNFGVGSTIPADHRFFVSFTLAGLGNFSPFNGALSGVPR
jgi:LPS-assembly protein